MRLPTFDQQRVAGGSSTTGRASVARSRSGRYRRAEAAHVHPRGPPRSSVKPNAYRIAVALLPCVEPCAPADPHVLDTMGWILFKRGSIDKAVKLLKLSAAQLPESPSVQYHLGMAAQQLVVDGHGADDAARAARFGGTQAEQADHAGEIAMVGDVAGGPIAADERVGRILAGVHHVAQEIALRILRARAAEMQAAGYVGKPFRPDELLRLVDRYACAEASVA